MSKIIAKRNFELNSIGYIAGEELKNLTFEQIKTLNEQGKIQPLSYEDLLKIKREIETKGDATK